MKFETLMTTVLALVCVAFMTDVTEETSFQYPEENTDSKIKAGRKSPGSRKEPLPCRSSAARHRTIFLSIAFFS